MWARTSPHEIVNVSSVEQPGIVSDPIGCDKNQPTSPQMFDNRNTLIHVRIHFSRMWVQRIQETNCGCAEWLPHLTESALRLLPQHIKDKVGEVDILRVDPTGEGERLHALIDIFSLFSFPLRRRSKTKRASQSGSSAGAAAAAGMHKLLGGSRPLPRARFISVVSHSLR